MAICIKTDNMIKKDISILDKETVLYLDTFEGKFEAYVKKILADTVYARIKVSYAMSLIKADRRECPFVVESNASLSLANSHQFVAQVVEFMKTCEDEFNAFWGSKAQLKVKFILEEKPEDKENKKADEADAALMYIPIEPRYSFDQLIIPDDLKKEIEEALGLLKYQNLIYKVWGFEKVDPIPKSVLNFYGPPGTGKTMCAHTIAKTLGKKLLALNYAEIESKYVGDSAKNLMNAFNTAKEHDCVLFFDEADSFLGKRIQNVTQGADQALNSLRSQMLILLEEFEGVVIFATNLVSNFDQAFESRILKHIKFVLPNEEARAVIIKKMIPEHLPFVQPLTDENIKSLSVIMEGLSGREIKGAILECMLAKVSKEGETATFSYDDFAKAFQHKQDALKALKEEKNRAKSEKILQALKDKSAAEAELKKEEDDVKETSQAESPTEEKEDSQQDKELKLIRLVAETGTFFGKCDGCFDESERSFVDNYIKRLQTQQTIPEDKVRDIKASVREDLTIEEVISQTKTFTVGLPEEEQMPFKRTMSYFIYKLIRADGVLHPNEIDAYEKWKHGVEIDDKIDVDNL